MTVTLYHFAGSLCSQKVRLALAEKGVAYTGRVVDIGPRHENYEPWYVRLNPNAVVPTLDHAGEIVTDSARIVRYIDDNFEGPSLTPDDSALRAEMETWVEKQNVFKMREITYSNGPKLLMPIARLTLGRRIKVLAKHRDSNPDLADAYDRKLEDVKTWRVALASTGQIEALHEELALLIGELEEQLEARDFITGTYSLADVVWTVFLGRIVMLKLDALWGDGKHPNVSAYYERLRARDTFEQALVVETFKFSIVAPMLLKFLGPRIAVAVAVVIGVVWGISAIL